MRNQIEDYIERRAIKQKNQWRDEQLNRRTNIENQPNRKVIPRDPIYINLSL